MHRAGRESARFHHGTRPEKCYSLPCRGCKMNPSIQPPAPMSEALHPPENKAGRRATIAVIALLLAILLVNLATALRYPAVCQYEVMYTDPAANLILGKGFTSTAWYVQTGEKFWAANTPLHEMALSGWIRIFGFSPLAVRSINYVW